MGYSDNVQSGSSLALERIKQLAEDAYLIGRVLQDMNRIGMEQKLRSFEVST